MTNYHIAKNIVHLPEEFYATGDITMHSLIKQTGYFEMHNEINRDDIYNELLKNPTCTEKWLD